MSTVGPKGDRVLPKEDLQSSVDSEQSYRPVNSFEQKLVLNHKPILSLAFLSQDYGSQVNIDRVF